VNADGPNPSIPISGEGDPIGAEVNLMRREQGVLLAIDYPDFQRRGAPLSVAIISTTAIIGAAKQRKLVGAAREVFGVRPQRGVSISEAIVQRILVSVKRGHAGS